MSEKKITEQDGVKYEVVRILQEEEKERVVIEGVGDVTEYEKWYDEEYCKLAVQENGDALQYVKTQTEELCKLAVQENGYALRYVDKRIFKKQIK